MITNQVSFYLNVSLTYQTGQLNDQGGQSSEFIKRVSDIFTNI